MRKLIAKIGLFVVILFVIEKMIESFFPYHSGNVWVSTKIRHLQENEISPNLLFIGSSRIYRQVDPTIVDRVLQTGLKQNIRSFNLGGPSVFCPETYYLLEHLLEDESINKDLKYVVVELMDIQNIDRHLQHQERSSYWMDTERFKFGITSTKSVYYLKNYAIAALENTFNLGHYGEAFLVENYYEDRFLGGNQNGYYPLDKALQNEPNDKVWFNLRQRRENLMKDTLLLQQVMRVEEKLFSSDRQSPNKIHLDKIKSLIEQFNASEIQLVFTIPPRYLSKETLALFQEIPERHRVDLGSPQAYSELYTTKYSFDSGHFNSRGGIIYSIKLGEALSNVLQ